MGPNPGGKYLFATYNNDTRGDATKKLDDYITPWNYPSHDLSSFDNVINTLDSPVTSVASLAASSAHKIATIDSHTASLPSPSLAASTTLNNQKDEYPYFDYLNDVIDFPQDHDTKHENSGIEALDVCLLLTDANQDDQCVDRHNHVSLQDVEFCSEATQQYDAMMQMTSYGDVESDPHNRHTGSVHREVVPEPLQTSPQNCVTHRGHNGDRRRAGGLRRSKPSAVIKDWYFAHSSSPYPSSKEIAAFATLSGQSDRQVKICLSNLRARTKASVRTLPTSAESATDNVAIHKTQSPSYNMQPVFDHSYAGHTSYGIATSSEALDEMRIDPIRFDPTRNLEIYMSEPNHPGEIRDQSLAGVGSKHFANFASKRKGRRQHPSRFDHASREPTSSSLHTSSDSGPDAKKQYHCTACCKSFKDVYGWKRHESSVHGYSDIEWVCMLTDLAKPGVACVFCSDIVNNLSHFDEHDVQSCLAKDVCERSFTRKDLLKQHVQQIHFATADESISRDFKVPKEWSKTVDAVRINNEALWCDFCLCACSSIAERMDHVAEHFRDGYDIKEWIPIMTT